FTIPQSYAGKNIYIDFDGAYMNSSVYINGQYAGGRPYGYASFSIDATPLLNENGVNTIAVKIDNSIQPNSRWYSGCGIYRNVWLRAENPVFIPKDGTYITTDGNTVSIDATLSNTSATDRPVEIRTTVSDNTGLTLAETTSRAVIRSAADTTVTQKLDIKSPRLWSPSSPQLYTVTTDVIDSTDGTTLDSDVTRTGFRSFCFDADKGFSLNGSPMKLNGVCLHHDAGALGAVVNKAAIRRQLSILKAMGCNAIRTSHNPPAPELLDYCDEMGFMVMDEAFDMWRKRKTIGDYANHFNEWHERDIDDFIRRDRNHPSVIVWSIGNEVLEQWTHADADTLSLAQA
ncbi:MAG: glycoside hydrolase family 2, partial [Muribaculaceae bacterium]|nr:glycoside hydrolase family 2 [Muribaculaceae bacterium]